MTNTDTELLADAQRLEDAISRAKANITPEKDRTRARGWNHQGEADVRRDLQSLRDQLQKWTGGHVYDGPDCVLCGHFGPVDAPEPCQMEELVAARKAMSDLGCEKGALPALISSILGQNQSLRDTLEAIGDDLEVMDTSAHEDAVKACFAHARKLVQDNLVPELTDAQIEAQIQEAFRSQPYPREDDLYAWQKRAGDWQAAWAGAHKRAARRQHE